MKITKTFFVETLEKMWNRKNTELSWNTHFQLLVAIVLSAQTTDIQVNKATKKLFSFMEKPEDLKDISIEKIQEAIKTLGFFRSKAKYVKGLGEILSKTKKIPETIEELIKLPGVGIKTSKVFLAEIHGKPVLAVDTHVHRVLNRLGFVNTKLAEETDKVAEKIFEDDDKIRLHHSLIFFGRYHCKAKKPECKDCVFLHGCKFGKNFLKEKK